jgi:hypothetical protein
MSRHRTNMLMVCTLTLAAIFAAFATITLLRAYNADRVLSVHHSWTILQ